MPKSLKKLPHSSVTYRRDDATTKESSSPSTIAARLQRILQKARDVTNIPRGEPSESATKQDAASSPSVFDAHDSHNPISDASPSLRRTASTASIDTVRPSSVRTVRRRIDQMGPNAKSRPNTKHKSSANKKNATEKSPPKLASETCNQDATSPSRGKTTKHKRQSAISARPLRDGQDPSEEDDISTVTARLLQTAPTAAWALQPSLFANRVKFDDGSLSESHELLSKEKVTAASGSHEPKHELVGLPTRSLKPGSHIVEDLNIAHLPRIATHDINDLQLLIRPYESDVTVWDVPSDGHYPFACQLFLKCRAQGPFDVLSLPDVRRIEFVCSTLSLEGHYAVRPPVLQTTYQGARIDTSSGKTIVLNAGDGVHIEKTWRSTMDGDGVWGWYAPVFTPISMRLFEKMEYRKFKVVGRLWMGGGGGGEQPVEAELMFGMALLLRELDMK